MQCHCNRLRIVAVVVNILGQMGISPPQSGIESISMLHDPAGRPSFWGSGKSWEGLPTEGRTLI